MIVNGLTREQLNTKGVIYKINFPSGKYYIGVTTRKLVDRIYDHRESILSGNQVIYKAFRKYGFENTTWEILETTKDKEKLFDLELFYVNKFKSNSWKYGYNMTEGGEGRSNSKHSKETLAKISGSNNHRAKINEELAESIKIDLYNGMSPKDVSEKYNVQKNIVSNIKRCKDWKLVREDLNEFLLESINKVNRLDDFIYEIKTLMYNGWSNSEISKKLNIKVANISEVRRLGVYEKVLEEYNDVISSSRINMTYLTEDNVRDIKTLLIKGKKPREICKIINLDYDSCNSKIAQIKYLNSYKNVHSELNDELSRLYGK